MKLSILRVLLLDGIEIGVLLSDFVHELRRINRFPRHFFYFTWRCWYISNSESESKCRNQTESNLGSVQKLDVNSCKSSTHKGVLLLGFVQLSESYRFVSIKGEAVYAFVRFKKEIRREDLAQIDKLAKYNNYVNLPSAHVDRLHRSVYAQRMQTKFPKN